MVCDRWRCALALLLGVGVVGALGACVLFFYVPAKLRALIETQTRLGHDEHGNQTMPTRAWVDPPYDMGLSVWTFSIQNPTEVLTKNAKPHVVEKGPYTFREFTHKKNEFAENDTRVSYRNCKTYFFEPQKSCETCRLSDPITVPNIVLQTIIDKLPQSGFVRSVVDAVLQAEKETAFVRTTVGEFLFQGYEDKLVTLICTKPFMGPFCRSFDIPDRVGLFYGKNGTDDGVYEIGTGQKTVWDISHVFSFNNKTHTNAYYGEKAREIKGTDGQMYPPGLDRRDSRILDIFVGQLCRSIQMEFRGGEKFQEVPVYTYVPARSMHDIDLQRSMGFCNPQTPRYFNNTYIQERGCAPMGLMDVSSCLPGNPRIYISQPHFFGSHPALREAVDGMASPDEQRDQTTIGIEPATAVVAYADQRTQLNLGVLSGGLRSLSAMQPRIVPLVWLREWATFDPMTRAQLLQLSSVRRTVFNASIGTFLLFCLCVVGSGVLVFVRNSRTRQGDQERLLEETDEQDAEPEEAQQE